MQQQPQQHMMQNKPQQAPMQQGTQNRSPYSSMAIPTNNNNASMNSANAASKAVKTLPSIKENYSTGIKLQEVNGANGRQLQVDSCPSVL
jgi:hypothetical protein